MKLSRIQRSTLEHIVSYLLEEGRCGDQERSLARAIHGHFKLADTWVFSEQSELYFWFPSMKQMSSEDCEAMGLV